MFLKRFFPDYIYDKVEDIPYNILKKENIKAIIFDMDNTLIDYKYENSKEIINWVEGLKKEGIALYILTNSPLKNKAENISKRFNIDYIINANKPWKFGFKRVQKILNMDKNNIAIVGDQIFTDIWGGNRFGIKTILVKPINEKEMFITRARRPFEKFILKKYYEYLKEGSVND